MALLGNLIDSRTFSGASFTVGATTTYAHGLPANPDFIIVQGIATGVTASNSWMINCVHDATNVTIQNQGQVTPPNFRVVAVVAHSIIR